MKMIIISLIIFLSHKNLYKIDSTEDMNRILCVVLKDSLTIEYFKVDGYEDSFMLDIKTVGDCPEHSFSPGDPPEKLWHYFIDTNIYNTHKKRYFELYRRYADEIDCEKFPKRLVNRDKLDFYNPNSNIKMNFDYLNDSIVHVFFKYKIHYSPKYSQPDNIYFYILITDSIIKIIYRGEIT